METAKLIEKILKPVQSGEDCPKKGKCDCLEKATDELLALFKKERKELITQFEDMVKESSSVGEIAYKFVQWKNKR